MRSTKANLKFQNYKQSLQRLNTNDQINNTTHTYLQRELSQPALRLPESELSMRMNIAGLIDEDAMLSPVTRSRTCIATLKEVEHDLFEDMSRTKSEHVQSVTQGSSHYPTLEQVTLPISEINDRHPLFKSALVQVGISDSNPDFNQDTLQEILDKTLSLVKHVNVLATGSLGEPNKALREKLKQAITNYRTPSSQTATLQTGLTVSKKVQVDVRKTENQTINRILLYVYRSNKQRLLENIEVISKFKRELKVICNSFNLELSNTTENLFSLWSAMVHDFHVASRQFELSENQKIRHHFLNLFVKKFEVMDTLIQEFTQLELSLTKSLRRAIDVRRHKPDKDSRNTPSFSSNKKLMGISNTLFEQPRSGSPLFYPKQSLKKLGRTISDRTDGQEAFDDTTLNLQRHDENCDSLTTILRGNSKRITSRSDAPAYHSHMSTMQKSEQPSISIIPWMSIIEQFEFKFYEDLIRKWIKLPKLKLVFKAKVIELAIARLKNEIANISNERNHQTTIDPELRMKILSDFLPDAISATETVFIPELTQLLLHSIMANNLGKQLVTVYPIAKGGLFGSAIFRFYVQHILPLLVELRPDLNMKLFQTMFIDSSTVMAKPVVKEEQVVSASADGNGHIDNYRLSEIIKHFNPLYKTARTRNSFEESKIDDDSSKVSHPHRFGVS